MKLCLAEPADAPLVASGHKMERGLLVNSGGFQKHPKITVRMETFFNGMLEVGWEDEQIEAKTWRVP